MSYILDALRRADAERGRGAVPGLHTPAASAPLPEGGAGGGPRTAVAVAVLAAGVVAVLAAGGWWWLRDDVPRGGVVPAAQVASTSVGVAPAPATPAGSAPPSAATEPSAAATVPRASPGAPAAGDSSGADAASAPIPMPAPTPAPALARTPAPASSSDPAPAPVSRERPVAQVQALGAAPTPAAARDTPAPEPAPRVPALAELPESVRRQLPPLAVSGATYSSNPRYRMVIVNGQVLSEGDPAGADVVLERIEPKAAVLRFKGQRFSVPY